MTDTAETTLPSYEEQDSPQNRVLLNPKTRRIRWTLNGPLETAITVARDWFFDPDKVPEPYHQGHAFVQAPLTKPKVSSLKLYVETLDDWDHLWMEIHRDHTDPDATYDPANVVYGPLPGVDEAELRGGKHLLVCCGLKRPWGRETQLVVKATGNFVTIHDFISTVHPYLMARRGDIIETMNLDPGRTRKPFGPETKLMVTWQCAKGVEIWDEADWRAYYTRNKPKLPLSSLNLPPALVNAMRLEAQRKRERPRSKTLEELWGSDDE
ncbi:hypothetical protein VTK56DRAFT_8875 [Thermocarpiscus australiensis]